MAERERQPAPGRRHPVSEKIKSSTALIVLAVVFAVWGLIAAGLGALVTLLVIGR